MLYYLISLIIFMIIMLFLTIKIKVNIKIDNYDLKIKIFNKEILNQNILQASKETFEIAYDSYLKQLISIDDIKYIKMIRKFKFKTNEFMICGLQNDYSKTL